MNVNIFPTGTGSARLAANYLLGDKDHTGKKRTIKPELLHGNPDTICAIADSTSRIHKYTSGAIAFRDTEHPTHEQIQGVISAFRSTFLPNLREGENYADMWVLHQDKGNVELHFLYANTELSGKQLNIHPPGKWNIDFFNNFTRVVNDSMGYAQVVEDPLKSALSKLDRKSPEFEKGRKVKQLVSRELQRKILSGKITNRDELIKEISTYMPVTRVGSNYITVQLEGYEKGTRLKGPLFIEGSDYKVLIQQHRESKVPKFLTIEESAQAKERLVEQINQRAAFNIRAYLTPPKKTYRREKGVKGVVATVSKAVHGVNNLMLPILIPTSKPKAEMQGGSSLLQSNPYELPLKAVSQKKSVPMKSLSTDMSQHAQDESIGEGGSIGDQANGLESQLGSIIDQLEKLKSQAGRANGSRLLRIIARIAQLELQASALSLEIQKVQANQKMKTGI
jgi:hypothetical protein